MALISMEFVTHIGSEITAGLIGIIVALAVERLGRQIRAIKVERRFPVAGTYISEYEDKGALVRAPIILNQRGSKVDGESRVRDRKWILKGQVTEDNNYLTGTYRPENRFDPGFGVFFMKIDRNCDMAGYWLGKDAEESEIQSGSYRFLKQPSFEVGPIAHGQVSDVLYIAEQQLGDAYISDSDVISKDDNIALCATTDSRVVGFGTCKLMRTTEFCRKFERFFSPDAVELRNLHRHLEGQETVGLLASVATVPSVVGRGIGTVLVERCITALEQNGANVFVATAWKSSNGVHAGSILENMGFIRVFEVPDYWKEDSQNNHYRCPVCGAPPCRCTAVVYIRGLTTH